MIVNKQQFTRKFTLHVLFQKNIFISPNLRIAQQAINTCKSLVYLFLYIRFHLFPSSVTGKRRFLLLHILFPTTFLLQTTILFSLMISAY